MKDLDKKEEINSDDVDEAQREEILERDNNQCVICGRPTHQIHHFEYKGMGGTSDSKIEGIKNKGCVCMEHHTMAHSEDISMAFVERENGELVLDVSGYDGRVWFNEKPERKAEYAQMVHAQLRESFMIVQEQFWEIGGYLRTIKDEQLYEGLDYDSFREYMKSPEIPISYKSGQKFIRVRRGMEKEINSGNIELRQVAEMGVEKASRIVQFVGEDNFDEWTHKALTLSQEDLKNEIRDSSRGEHQKISESKDTDEMDMTESPSNDVQEPSGTPETETVSEYQDKSPIDQVLYEKIVSLSEKFKKNPKDKELVESLWQTVREYMVKGM